MKIEGSGDGSRLVPSGAPRVDDDRKLDFCFVCWLYPTGGVADESTQSSE